MDQDIPKPEIDVSNIKHQSLTSIGLASEGFDLAGEQNFKGRLENTSAGMVIGSVRDLFGEPETVEEKVKKAGENDFAAEMIADVLVMLPKFRAAKAGLARAALLSNPHQGLNQDVFDLTTNFAEGVALNKVSRSMLPGSGLNKFTAHYLGNGLKAEAATHMAAGFGFGSVKAGFDRNTWIDQSGNLSLLEGTEKVLKTGATASLINLPAGMIGMRAAGITTLGARNLSPRAQSLLIGSTSGYTSGAVVGGIEAVKEGKGLVESLDLINKSGLIGLGTGAAFMSAMPMDHASLKAMRTGRFGKVSRASEIDLGSEEALMSSRRAMEASGRSKSVELTTDRSISKNRNPLAELEYFPREDVKLSKLSRRLTDATRVEADGWYLPDDVDASQYTSLEDFVQTFKPRKEKVVEYKVQGHEAKVVVSEDQVGILDLIRTTRQAAAKKTAYDGLTDFERSRLQLSGDEMEIQVATGKVKTRVPTREALNKHMTRDQANESLQAIKARQKLALDPDMHAALPEDMIAVLDELPNPKLVKKVILDKSSNPQDAWYRAHYDPEFESSAAVSRDGVITYYKPEISYGIAPEGVNIDGAISRYNLRFYGRHEWSHSANFGDKLTDGLYHLAKVADLDVPVTKTAQTKADEQAGIYRTEGSDKYYARTYARMNQSEDWAVHLGEEFMSSDASDFITLAERAPVRTTILYMNLRGNMRTGANTNIFGKAISSRMQHVETKVFPEAWKVLEQRLATGTDTEKLAAVELLGNMGDAKKHVGRLLEIARDPASTQVKDGVHSLTEGQISRIDPKGVRTLADNAFDAAQSLAVRGAEETNVTFLTKMARFGEPEIQQMATNRLRQIKGGDDLIRFSKLAGDPQNMTTLMEMVQSARTNEAQSVIFDEVIALGKKGEYANEFIQSILMRTADRVPSQRMKALKLLGDMAIDNPSPQVKEFLGRHTIAGNQESRARAEKILFSLNEREQVRRVAGMLDRGGSDRMEGLRIAKGIDDRDMIVPLLKVLIDGTPEQTSLAGQALSQYPQNIVRFKVRLEGPDLGMTDSHWRMIKKG